MTELDFDELDKAVNNLMTEVDTSSPTPSSSDEAPENVVTIPSTSTPPAAVPVSAPASATPATTQPEAISTASPSLATKRRGQFMDVVHPSSNMAKPTPKVRREATVVAPSSDMLTPEPAAEPVDGQPVEEPANEVPNPAMIHIEPLEATGSPGSQTDPITTPDPIEPEGQQPTELDNSTDTQMSAEADAVSTESSDSQAIDLSEVDGAPTTDDSSDAEPSSDSEPEADVQPEPEEKPLSSPFLPDAKVEKRPLGGIPVEIAEEAEPTPDTAQADTSTTDTESLARDGETTAEENSADKETPSEEVSSDDADAPAPAPSEVKKPLPEELNGEILALESSTTGEGEDAKDPAESTEMIAVESQPATGGPTSIPRQYDEQPSSGDQSNGSIYDTDSYHQPLAHPEKHKSSWGMIIAIIVLLIVGALGGAAYFYFASM